MFIQAGMKTEIPEEMQVENSHTLCTDSDLSSVSKLFEFGIELHFNFILLHLGRYE